MRSVAIVDDPDRARALAGTLSEYDASAVDPQALEGPGDYDVVVADWDTPVVGRLVTDRDGRSWGVVAVVDDGTETDPVADGADGVVARPVDAADLRATIDRVAVQRAYLGAVRTAAAGESDDWRAAADDLLDALRDDLSAEELFRRLL